MTRAAILFASSGGAGSAGRTARPGTFRRGFVAAALLLIALASAGRSVAGVTVSVLGPAQVTPGTNFDVTIQVTQAGSAFNAFDAIVGYDPAALTLVALSPLSLQEGSMMTGACGNRFHRFRPGADRDTVNLALLCNGVSVSGPGTIYRLRFHASNTPQATTIRFLPGLRFYQDGLLVLPVTSQDLTLGIGTAVSVGPLAPGRVLRLRAGPNPARGVARFQIDTGVVGDAELRICDVTGRRVRSIPLGWLPAGGHVSTWDGRSGDGTPQPAGLYRARLRVGGEETSATLVWVR